ncbi:hypothetical protein [Bombella saccharophila]|uniref:Uncharacterized protein n=1 Tax=Bombella saccharophila TaxID=2967338 RepID=A0ABT3WAM6_9PROT|nr:hypothetical protein [Bombella saccharophila]MCX5615330.1 hypothetical protein [Bombella saccharophila]
MADTTPSLSALIAAGESVFTAATGKSSANVDKVTAGLTSVADGSLPFLENKVKFDLGKVIAGATAILTGTALVLSGLKKRDSTTATETPSTTSHTGGVG